MEKVIRRQEQIEVERKKAVMGEAANVSDPCALTNVVCRKSNVVRGKIHWLEAMYGRKCSQEQEVQRRVRCVYIQACEICRF